MMKIQLSGNNNDCMIYCKIVCKEEGDQSMCLKYTSDTCHYTDYSTLSLDRQQCKKFSLFVHLLKLRFLNSRFFVSPFTLAQKTANLEQVRNFAVIWIGTANAGKFHIFPSIESAYNCVNVSARVDRESVNDV